MIRLMSRVLSVALLLLTVPALARGPVSHGSKEPVPITGTKSRPVPGIGDVAPSLDAAGVLDLVQGERLGSLSGQVTVLAFFALWCPGCINELPMLNALHRDFAGRDLRVVTVSIDPASERQRLEAHLKRVGVKHTVLADPDERLKRVWQGRRTSMPYLVVIDREGVVRHIEEGFDPAKTPALRTLLSELLRR